ncbi:hypothetical protein C5167_037102 [Papaver somniferum]|uniref:Uncharacterized protein n=1 Tax=Papaver somniferum TaxID=3469 RepID=A0A4Y7I8V5_PAPSO|nr:hypothetical protein C5167_037102 [Papaver somniferum]
MPSPVSSRCSLRQSKTKDSKEIVLDYEELARLISQDWRNERRARLRELVTQVGTSRWLNTGRVSLGRCWCARYVDSPVPSWELAALSGRRLGLCDRYSGGHRVRLVSQSNEHLLLLTVEGLRVDVPQFQLSLRRAPRQAGFTEQRTPPALDSGRITSQCAPVPTQPGEPRTYFGLIGGAG